MNKNVDILALIEDETRLISYRPTWNAFTGSVNASILLQQIIYRWIKNKRQPFYKFSRPCGHGRYRKGDSWEEELGMSRSEFETARKKVSTRTRGNLDKASLVSYWMDADHCTWYALNETAVIAELAKLHPDEPDTPPVGIQSELVQESSIRHANGVADAGIQHQLMQESSISKCENPASELMKESSIRSTKKINIDDLNKNDLQTSPSSVGELNKNDVDDVLPLDDEKSLHPLPAETVELVTAVADWMGFTGDITYEMQRHGLMPAALLAWAFWVKVDGGRCRNPVGVCISKWTGNGRRGPELPPSKWLDLARAWLDLDDNGRSELLGTGGASYMLSYDFPYPDVMPAFSELYKATQGHPLPEALKPVYPEHLEEGEEQGGAVLGDEPDELEEVGTAVAIPVNGQRNPEVDELWTLLLFNETSPAFKMWLKDTKLLVDDMRAVIVVHNSYAAEWVNSLLEAINRNWKILTRHTGQEWHELTITGAVEEAYLVAA
ncbi:hypothetical protein KC887_08405 [Candidatus Kaiserbacteria bacterium]|nr:hypothetical protein [Candidatus Kaiserbacteria bacterium]